MASFLISLENHSRSVGAYVSYFGGFQVLSLGHSAGAKIRNAGATFLTLDGFKVLSQGHREGAKIRKVGGYVSYFGWFEGP